MFFFSTTPFLSNLYHDDTNLKVLQAFLAAMDNFGLTTATSVDPTTDDYTNYILSNQNSVIGWYKLAATYTLKANSAFLSLLTADVNAARSITMDFGDGSQETGICSAEIKETAEKADTWYTVDGRKLDKQPTRKGLYINNGRKIVVK